MKNTIGKRIKQIRGETSIPVFAEIFGLSPHTIMRYESGKTDPGASFVFKLCEHYKIDPNWIFYGKNNELAEETPMPANSQGLVLEQAKTTNDSGKKASQICSDKQDKDLSKIISEWALDLSPDEFKWLLVEYWNERSARRGWLQIEITKRFPEFIEWLEQRQAPLTPAHIVTLKKGEQLARFGPPDQPDDD